MLRIGAGCRAKQRSQPRAEAPGVHQLGVHLDTHAPFDDQTMGQPVAQGLAVDDDDVLQERIAGVTLPGPCAARGQVTGQLIRQGLVIEREECRKAGHG